MKQDIYESSTFGPIPLSFTGKRLLANLRESTEEALSYGTLKHNDNAVSKDRARIAHYISSLEQRLNEKVNDV